MSALDLMASPIPLRRGAVVKLDAPTGVDEESLEELVVALSTAHSINPAKCDPGDFVLLMRA